MPTGSVYCARGFLNRGVEVRLNKPPVLNGTVHDHFDAAQIVDDLAKVSEVTVPIIDFNPKICANGLDQHIGPDITP